MLKKQIWSLLMIFPVVLQAQVVINVQLPPSGMVHKDQLWNLVLANNSSTEYDAKLLFNLQDITSGQSVLMASTPSFSLGKGMKVLNSREVQPVHYNFATAGSGSEFIPFGSYNACYTLYKIRLDAMEKLTEECVRINISPLSPPQLITPVDKSVLSNGIPQFSWTAPAPLDVFNDLTYEMNLTEVLPGQSAIQALQFNPLHYAKNGLKSTFDVYPSSSYKLEEGKTYAWQVTARSGANYRASTEAWTFSLAGDSSYHNRTDPAYILLKSNKDEARLSYVKDTLYIKYYSFDKAHDAFVRFFSTDGKLLEEKKQSIIYGENFLRFSIGNRYRKEQPYRFELDDQRGKTYTTFFIIQ